MFELRLIRDKDVCYYNFTDKERALALAVTAGAARRGEKPFLVSKQPGNVVIVSIPAVRAKKAA